MKEYRLTITQKNYALLEEAFKELKIPEGFEVSEGGLDPNMGGVLFFKPGKKFPHLFCLEVLSVHQKDKEILPKIFGFNFYVALWENGKMITKRLPCYAKDLQKTVDKMVRRAK